jgi:hypothetical protein
MSKAGASHGPTWRSYARAAVPRRAHYYVLGSPSVPDYNGPEFCPLTREDLGLLESSRPGFGGVAQRFLDAGHRATKLVVRRQIACLQFRFINLTEDPVRVSYFPLRPGEVWLHHGWVHPEHRGRRLLQSIVDFDRYTDCDLAFVPHFVANVLTDNTAAVKSCQSSGMRIEGRFDSWQWIRYEFGRRRDGR